MLDAIISNPLTQTILTKAGVPAATKLTRGRGLPDTVALAALNDATLVRETLAGLGITPSDALMDTADTRTEDEKGRFQPAPYPAKVGAVVVDATAVATVADTELLRQALRPAMKGIAASGRLILVGLQPDALTDVEQRAVHTGLDPLMRTLAKELRAGATANLIQVLPTTPAAALDSTLRFFLEGRSAYVDGQPVRVGDEVLAAMGDEASASDEARSPYDPDQPFAGRIVVVTGAARGIGAAISRTLARDGATVVGVDIPAAGEALAALVNEVKGSALQLDITADDAGERICEHIVSRYGADARIHAVIHNAGITKDRMLVNLDEKAWCAVLDVNLAAQLRMNKALLDPQRPGSLADGGRVVGLASTVGIAGNRGQTNYATTKGGVIGLARAMTSGDAGADLAARGITYNAVAPGFIETEMTKKIPPIAREIFRKTNSLAQGGLPVDVAETVAWLADPATAAVTGQVVRTCGQNLTGA